jgi:predicted alternative tryptophan synthase beta-subunit
MTPTKHGWDRFREYRQGDLGRVWSDIREEDLAEIRDGGVEGPEAIEQVVISMGAKMLTWDTDEGPAAVVGVTPTGDPKVGLVWAVAANKARPRWRFAARETEGVLQKIAGGHSVLSNFKDTRNLQQINWLKRVGFTFINRHQGANGLTYLEFVRIMT